jgi:alkylation response protein AidB-like acyl-CoA dehydrogenase
VDFELTDAQVALQQTLREFAQAEIVPAVQEYDRSEQFPYGIVRKLGELGVMGLPFPEQYGGVGAGDVAMALALEELARVDSSVAITVAASVSLGGWPLLAFGTEAQKQRWLVPLAQGRTLGAFASTEPSAGSDVHGISTTARLKDGDWVLNGTKAFITNAGTEMSAFTIATAVTGRDGARPEVSTFLVSAGTAGFMVAKPYRKIGWRASDTRELSFQECRLPSDAMLGPRGAGARQFLATLDGGRIGVAAMSVGLGQGCLDLAGRYASERTAFGQSIARYQGVHFKLAELATEIDAARLLTYRAAWHKEHGRAYTREASMAKLFASEVAVRAADVGLQVFGGYGFIEESPIARFYRDAKILTIGEGTSEIQKIVIARQMGLPA